MKKIINDVGSVADDMLKGMAKAHPALLLDERHRFVYREPSGARVSVVSGGGSGHEPLHAGFVGPGMLTAAVCGDVFASPSSVQVYSAIDRVASEKGVLLVIKNYSGDVMNFDMAAEMAEMDGIDVAKVYVDDDIAVDGSLYTVGRRGVAGTAFVHKVAGAAAEEGRSLGEVKRLAEKAAARVRSLGIALTSCTVPAKGAPTFAIADDEIEFGVGIHGEPGIERQKLRGSKELAHDMVGRLCGDLALERGDSVCVMLNGLGATPLMELYIAYSDVADALASRGIGVYRPFVGSFTTSLDMAGMSVTLFAPDDETRPLLDSAPDTPARVF